MEWLAYLMVGAILGGAIGALWQRSRLRATAPQGVAQAVHDLVVQRAETLNLELRDKEVECIDLHRAIATLEQQSRELQLRLEERGSELKQWREAAQAEFKEMADRLMDDKGRQLQLTQHEMLRQLLQPLGERIAQFERQVQQTHVEDTRQRATLTEQLKQLTLLNQQIGTEAANLARALTTDNKKLGGWGEWVLERLLEAAGLTKGRDYTTQEHLSQGDRRLIPDVILHLPGGRHLVLDAKTSLASFERWVNDTNPDTRPAHLREHLQSLRRHVRDLSDKAYHRVQALHSPDFVLMFVPIEGAFAAAVTEDPNLLSEALEAGVVLVSPSALLATLRLVAMMWQQERQNANALEIARKSGELYDRFAEFVKDLQEVGQRLRQTQEAHEKAMRKLTVGQGSLIKRAEVLRQLGAKNSKRIDIQTAEAEQELPIDEPM